MDNMEEFHIPKEAYERLNDPETVLKQIRDGVTFQEILGYDSSTMNKFYGAASRLFDLQEYRKSADSFSFLTTMNPYVHSYWVGLGMSEQLDGEYADALLAYAMAVLTDVENPIPHYHSATCYKELGELEDGIDALQMTIEYAGGNKQYSQLKEHAQSLKLRWENLRRNK